MQRSKFWILASILGATAAPASSVFTESADPAEITRDYLSWSRVSPTGYTISSESLARCFRMYGSHAGNAVAVYTNPVAQAALGFPRPLPSGSIIVKQKMPSGDGKTTNLGVMVKHGPGFDSQGGDWEYLVFAGEELELAERGKITRCRSCHSRARESDFVFLPYLGTE